MTSKKKLGENTRQFLVDTNLFIAAIKNPKKETASLRLLLELINDTTVVLIGNEFLVMEMKKYAQVFESNRGKEILKKLIDKTEAVNLHVIDTIGAVFNGKPFVPFLDSV